MYIGPYYESTCPKISINCKLLMKVSNLELKKKIYHTFEALMLGNRQYTWPLIKAFRQYMRPLIKAFRQYM
jgi:hypothetical protein